MQRLHIPLSRHTSTTRRPRWVVSLYPFVLLSAAMFVYWGSVCWFTRDTIYKAAPKDWVLATRFFVSEKTLPELSALFKNLPLVSHRSILFDDLAPYIHGEFVIFWKSNNSWSVVLRTKKELPQMLLDSEQIVQTPTGSHLVLLSESQEALQPISLAQKIIPPFPNPWKKWVGEIVLKNEPKRGWIFAKSHEWQVHFPQKTSRPSFFFGIPKETIAYLSSAGFPLNQTEMSLTQAFLPLTKTIVHQDFLRFLQNIPNSEGTSVLTQDEQGIGWLNVSKMNPSIENLENVLPSISALNEPKIQKTTLSDGTVVQEIVVNPDAVASEQVTLSGLQTFRVKTGSQDFFAAKIDPTTLLLSNRESLVRFFQEHTKKYRKTFLCHGNQAGFQLKSVMGLLEREAEFAQYSIFENLSEIFSSAGIVNNLYSTDILFCK